MEAVVASAIVGLVAGIVLEHAVGSEWFSDAGRTLIQSVIIACVATGLLLVAGIGLGWVRVSLNLPF